MFIAFLGGEANPHRTGYWDQEPDGRPALLEDGPGWRRADGALRWGLERAPRVWIRLEDAGASWWAGEGEPPSGEFAGILRLGP